MCGRVVLADARGHVVSRFGFTYIVQDDHGQRAHGFSDADLSCGDRLFSISSWIRRPAAGCVLHRRSVV